MVKKKTKEIKKNLSAKKNVFTKVETKTPLKIDNNTIIVGLAVILCIFVITELSVGVDKILQFKPTKAMKAPGAAAFKGVKRPFYVSGWSNFKHAGLTSLRVFDKNLYVLDNTRGQIFRYDAATGEFHFNWNDSNSVVQDSKGGILVLQAGGRIVKYGPDFKAESEVVLAGLEQAGWLEIDSDDNLYIPDYRLQKVIKFGSDFKKTAEFGGRGSGRDKFSEIGKIFISKNEIFCMDSQQGTPGMEIKVFGTDGKFKRVWRLKNLKVFSNLMNMAIDGDYVYINSHEESKISVYNRSGRLMTTFNTDASGNIQISHPSTIADGRGNGYIYIPIPNKIAYFTPIVF